jgi:hypothetical protein
LAAREQYFCPNRAYAAGIVLSDQDFSLTDAVSFVVMQERGIEQAFTFGNHFAILGFQIIPVKSRPNATSSLIRHESVRNLGSAFLQDYFKKLSQPSKVGKSCP